MEKNVGSNERFVRIGLGIAAGLLAFKMRKSKFASGLLLSGAASVIKSGVSQYCPMKAALGVGSDEAVGQGAKSSHTESSDSAQGNYAQSGAV
ncbi:MAG: DUF2892 domain-containing protein [Proteobacteria bacterium]|nr:MAG: DUF2892 domain-containing protein [Pseudomonadota bacterium]